MAVTLALTEAQEQRLHQAAQARQIDTTVLLQQIVDTALAQLEPPVTEDRIPGLHAGPMFISDDFDDPLPDEFWLGEE